MATRQNDSACLINYVLYTHGEKTDLHFDRYMKFFACPELILSDQSLGLQILKLYAKVEMTDAQFIEFIKHLESHLNSKVHLYAYYVLTGDLWKKILNMNDRFPEELKEQFYQKILDSMRKNIAENKDKDPNINSMISTYNSFNTLFAQGKLLGSVAPEIDFL